MVYDDKNIPTNDPRIERADFLIAAIANRFRMPAKNVADMTIAAGRKIKQRYPDEDLLDVFDAPFAATTGMDEDLPELSGILAAYGVSRLGGGAPRTAKRITYAMFHLKHRKVRNEVKINPVLLNECTSFPESFPAQVVRNDTEGLSQCR